MLPGLMLFFLSFLKTAPLVLFYFSIATKHQDMQKQMHLHPYFGRKFFGRFPFNNVAKLLLCQRGHTISRFYAQGGEPNREVSDENDHGHPCL